MATHQTGTIAPRRLCRTRRAHASPDHSRASWAVLPHLCGDGTLGTSLPLAGCSTQTPLTPALRRAARSASLVSLNRYTAARITEHAPVSHRAAYRLLRMGALADLEDTPA